jgi:hypothetical protein
MSNSAAVYFSSRSNRRLELAHGALYSEAQREGRRRFLRPQALDGGLAFANSLVWFHAAVELLHGLS